MFSKIKPCLILTVTATLVMLFVQLSALHLYPFPPCAPAVIYKKENIHSLTKETNNQAN